MYPTRIIAAVQSSLDCQSVLNFGKLMSGVFGAPVFGFHLPDPRMVELCRLPAAFLPGAPGRKAITGRSMEAAMTAEASRLQRMFGSQDISAVAGGGPKSPGHGSTGGLADIMGEGDLIVRSIDLSVRPLDREILNSAQFRPPAGGVLLVPDRAAGARGIVLALAGSNDDPAIDAAIEIAGRLRAELLVWQQAGPGSKALDLRLLPKPSGTPPVHMASRRSSRLPDANDLSGEPVRMLVCTSQSLQKLELGGRRAIVHRHRAPILVV